MTIHWYHQVVLFLKLCDLRFQHRRVALYQHHIRVQDRVRLISRGPVVRRSLLALHTDCRRLNLDATHAFHRSERSLTSCIQRQPEMNHMTVWKTTIIGSS